MSYNDTKRGYNEKFISAIIICLLVQTAAFASNDKFTSIEESISTQNFVKLQSVKYVSAGHILVDTYDEAASLKNVLITVKVLKSLQQNILNVHPHKEEALLECLVAVKWLNRLKMQLLTLKSVRFQNRLKQNSAGI